MGHKSEAIKKLIVGVLNAKSTDEAAGAIYKNGHVIAPDMFKSLTGTKYTFPAIGIFESQFDSAELLILKLLHNRERLRSTINEKLSGELGLLAYDVDKEKFQFTTYYFEQLGDDFTRRPSETVEASENEVENCVRDYCPNTDFDISLYVNFQDYKDHEVALSKQMRSMSVPRTKEIIDQLKNYDELVTEHEVIRGVQITSLMLIDDLIAKKKISPRSFIIQVITSRFERISRVKCYVNEEGAIKIDLALVAMSFDRTEFKNKDHLQVSWRTPGRFSV